MTAPTHRPYTIDEAHTRAEAAAMAWENAYNMARDALTESRAHEIELADEIIALGVTIATQSAHISDLTRQEPAA